MDRITHKVRCEQWTKIIKECLASGMSKTAWCREHGISDKAFFYWQRRLREEAYISTIESSSSLPAVSVPEEPSVDFVELRLPEQSARPSAAFRPDVIIRKDSFSLEISNTASAELLSRIGGLLHAE
ncbi:MAG: transposase [bacterium]|nr:transposase [bacterium]MDY4771580.1 transposase [Lachnospiraceae bacterium]